MKLNDLQINKTDLMRIIQETVPGKQITMAHVIASPDSIIYKKLGLDPKIDYKQGSYWYSHCYSKWNFYNSCRYSNKSVGNRDWFYW